MNLAVASLAFVGLMYMGRAVSCAGSGPRVPIVPGVRLADLKRRCRTGDLLVWSGQGRDAMTVKGWSLSSFSHVGMIVRCGPEELYVWNADVETEKKDVITGETNDACQLNDLEESVRACSGHAYWSPLGAEIKVDMEELMQFIRWNHGRKFDYSVLNLLAGTPIGKALLPRGISGVGHVFCSQLLADTYKHLGLLKSHVQSVRCSPSYFVRAERFEPADWKYGARTFEPLRRVQVAK